MPKKPPLTYGELRKALNFHGFSRKKAKGSHTKYRKGDRVCILAGEGNTEIPKGTLKSIAKQAGLPKDCLYRHCDCERSEN